MHLYSRAVGLKSIESRVAMDRVIRQLIDQAILNNHVIYYPDEESADGFYEAQINAVMLQNDMGGIVIRGVYNPAVGKFHRLFDYPYIAGTQPHFCSAAHIERQADKEAYMVHCNDNNREVSPIFFLTNIVDYLRTAKLLDNEAPKMVFMSAMATEGRIILPIKKTQAQAAEASEAAKKRAQLVDLAMQGDRDAIDKLTIGDYDTISHVCRRILKEDVLSVVDSSFIPSGLECDAYTVVGNIEDIHRVRNRITDEEVYVLTLECNDVTFDLGINREDLLGMPQKGFRFAGKIWLQGSLAI